MICLLIEVILLLIISLKLCPMKKPFLLLVGIVWFAFLDGYANNPDPCRVGPACPAGSDTSVTTKHKKTGHFFITPFYQYTHFTKLKLTSSTNYYKTPDGETSDPFTQKNIDQYNKYYGTEYTNSMMGIKAGYQVLDGLGVSVYAGVCHFILKSWISDLNTQTLATEYPGLLLGASVNYEHTIWKKLSGIALASFNYCGTGSGQSTTPSGNNVISSKLYDIYWDVNVVLAYRLGRFQPYAGAGYTQQYINSISTEQYVTNDGNGDPYTEQDRYDSHYRGRSVYGFAGLEFMVNHLLSVYARGAFINPARVTFGLRFTL